MRTQTLSAERMSQIEAASHGAIEFKREGNTVRGITIAGPFGPVFVEIASYSINVCEEQRTEVYCVEVTHQLHGHEVVVGESFETERERDAWMREHEIDPASSDVKLFTKEIVG